jgi:hypothetical protein
MKEFVQLKLNWGLKYYKTNTTNSSLSIDSNFHTGQILKYIFIG